MHLKSTEDSLPTSQPPLTKAKDLPDHRVPLLKLTEETSLAWHSQGDHHTGAGG